MKKIIIAIVLLLIGLLMPGATLWTYYTVNASPADQAGNTQLLTAASLFGAISLLIPLILAVLSIFVKYQGLWWAFLTSIVTHYLFSFYFYYGGGFNREPMAVVFAPLFVGFLAFLGALPGFLAYFLLKRGTAAT